MIHDFMGPSLVSFSVAIISSLLLRKQGGFGSTCGYAGASTPDQSEQSPGPAFGSFRGDIKRGTLGMEFPMALSTLWQSFVQWPSCSTLLLGGLFTKTGLNS